MNTPIIASILAQLGFATRTTPNGVIVSLNRPVSTLEVEIALAQEFEGIEFKVSRISKNQVLVQEQPTMTKKERTYRNQIEALTTRLTTCHLDDFDKVQAELFKVKCEATEYQSKLQQKRGK